MLQPRDPGDVALTLLVAGAVVGVALLLLWIAGWL
jgi:hypothetical protein